MLSLKLRNPDSRARSDKQTLNRHSERMAGCFGELQYHIASYPGDSLSSAFQIIAGSFNAKIIILHVLFYYP